MKKLKVLFFLFVIVQAAFYLFLIPPWQSPDESHQFGYGALLSKDIKLIPQAYENVEKKIIESMDKFNAWKYQFIPPLSPLPHRLYEVPFFGDGGGISLVTGRAPLYYLLISFFIKELKINEILNQFYLIRSLSFIFFVFTIYFIYLSAKIFFSDKFLYCLATVSFVAFLPQFLIISTSVNPINLAVFLETFFIYLTLLFLNKGKKILVVLFGPIIIGLGFFNHRAAIFMIPPFLVFLLIYFIESLKNKRELLKVSIAFIIALFLLLAIYLVAHYLFPDSLNKVIRESNIKPEINNFIQYLSVPSSKGFSLFLEGFFKSFWYFAGWLRFAYPVDIYSVLKIICLLSFLGLLKYLFFTLAKKNYKSQLNLKSFLILSAAVLPIIFATIVRYLPIVETAQGRYIFPAISAMGILFLFGLKEIAPKKLEMWLPIFIIVGFIVLNIFTLFNALIRVFYYFTNA